MYMYIKWNLYTVVHNYFGHLLFLEKVFRHFMTVCSSNHVQAYLYTWKEVWSSRIFNNNIQKLKKSGC